ncbi:MAG: fibronectin type III domain-containing protein [Peptostreptococcaceae bacterium]
MDNNIIYPENYNIIGTRDSSISTFGAGQTTNKFARLASALTKLSMNRYRLTVDIWGSSGDVFNNYGVKVYAVVVNGSSHHLGTFTMSGTSARQYHWDFDIVGNTSVYAQCVCSHCENNAGDDHYNNFFNYTQADTAIYENPNSAPTTPSIECTNTVINGNNIYIERNVTLRAYGSTDPNGDNFYYQIYGQYYNGTSWVNMTGSSASGQIDTTTSGNISIDVSSYNRGTRFKFWATASDDKETSSASSSVSNIYRNTVPTKPTRVTIPNAISVNNKLYVNETMQVNAAGSTDFESPTTLRYNFYGKALNPSTNVEESMGDGNFFIGKGVTIDIDVRKYLPSTKFTIWAKSVDNWDIESVSSDLVIVYKNSPPTAPTLSTSAIVYNNKYYIIDTCTLTASGSTDAENDSISYIFYGSYRTTPTGSWISLGDSNNEIGRHISTINVNTSSIPRGSQLQLWAKALDSAGNISETSNTLDNVYKNRLPGNITTLNINSVTNVLIGQRVSLNWNTVTDPDSHPVSYIIKITSKGPNDTVAITGTYYSNNTSFDTNISGYKPGTRFTFEVKAKDLLNEEGQGMVSSEYMKDFKPEVVLPSHPSIIYQKNPRIILKTIECINIGYKIVVDCNGTVYNSVMNHDMFTRGELDGNDNRIFVFKSKDLLYTNNIKIKVILDNIFTSSETDLAIECRDIIIDLNNGIKASIYSQLIDINNILRESYKMPISLIAKPVSGTIIQKTPILELRNSLLSIENKVNSYDPTDKNTVWNTLGPLIKKNDINSIVTKCRDI